MPITRNKTRPKGFWSRVYKFFANNQIFTAAVIVVGVIASFIEIWNYFNSISENHNNYVANFQGGNFSLWFEIVNYL
jgi:hypothetical protein